MMEMVPTLDLQPGEGDPRIKDIGEAFPDWPAEQPPDPRPRRYFCCGRYFGCCPLTSLCFPIFSCAGYIFSLVVALALLPVCLILGCFFWCFSCYTRSWNYQGPGSWVGCGSYVKILYLAQQFRLSTFKRPIFSPESISIGKLKPKAPLDKKDVDYALDIMVPLAAEAEFRDARGFLSSVALEHMAKILPANDDSRRFEPNENPVNYVMSLLGGVYPVVRDEWVDKQSDRALARFALHGLAAHRVETVTEGGVKYYVVRTNQLSGLPVRGKFAKYGGDAYFDAHWNPVKIVDDGFAKGRTVVSRPGDAMWNHAKFRFRSSVSLLVTVVDHLYGIHLQVANILITAARESLSSEHPLRRFLTPFSYGTIAVNADARTNLIQPRSLGPRNFAFSDKGMSLAFAAAPRLIMSGLEVPAAEGGPFLNRLQYYAYLKDTKGIDTEYTRQAARIYKIFFDFLDAYLGCYYPTDEAFASDPEVKAMFEAIMRGVELPIAKETTDPAEVAELWKHCIANFMWQVTAGHEHVGGIQCYMQDPSFCAWKWLPGENIATKESALMQALLTATTSTPMPMLLGSDWSYLFPAVPADASKRMASTSGGPLVVFQRFQYELKKMAKYCDKYDASASERPFPECFPLTVMNPKNLECSVSV